MGLMGRIIGAMAAGLATWLELVLAKHLGVTVSPEEHAQVVGFLVAVLFATYGMIHHLLRRWHQTQAQGPPEPGSES